MGTDGSPSGGPTHASIAAAALWSLLLGGFAQGLHLFTNADGLSAFAPIAYVGFLAPLIALGTVAITVIVRSAMMLGWVATDPRENFRRAADWMWRGEVSSLADRTAAILSAAAAVLAYGAVSWGLGRAILDTVARPEMGLALLGGAQLIVAFGALGVFIVLFRPLRIVLRRVGRRALVAPASLLAAGIGAGILTAIVVRTATDVGQYLPWDLLSAFVAAIAGWLAVRLLNRPWPMLAIGVLALTGTFGVTVFMPASLRTDRSIFTDDSPLTAALYRPVHAALDRDGDGAIDVYGGGDCAPDDKNIHPEALEKLNNGIDEDCSGADFTDDVTFNEAAISVGKPSQLPTKPNIILITTDSLSLDRTSLGREDRDTTPNLAAWALEHGVVYDAAFALGPSTRLAFPGIMASQFNSSVRMEKGRGHPYNWAPSTPTIASALSAAGYRTVMVTPDPYFAGRWKNGPSTGFAVRDHSATKKPADRIHTAPEVTAAAVQQLEASAKDKRPTFMWVHYYDHHSPFRRPKGGADFGSGTADIFDSELQFADRHWGDLFQAIDRVLDPKNTIVIFTSDHGESFDEFHPKKHHGHDLRNPVMHVPLIIAAPGVAPRRVAGLVSHADIPPTLADLSGVRRNKEWIGESLVPTLWKGADPQKTVVFGLFYLPERYQTQDAFSKISARTSDWYYERNLRDGAERLTNWRKDTSGEHDLSGKQRETVEVLRQLSLQKLDALKKSERGLSRLE